MATWHQQQARKRGMRLYHATLWTVLDDPPGECSSAMLFPTSDEANAYVNRREALGTGKHLYILKPESLH